MHRLIRNSRAEEATRIWSNRRMYLTEVSREKMHNVLPLLPFSFRTYPLLRNTTNEPNVNWTARWKHRFIESREKGLVREAATSNARPPNDLLALRCRRRKEDDERSARDYWSFERRRSLIVFSKDVEPRRFSIRTFQGTSDERMNERANDFL